MQIRHRFILYFALLILALPCVATEVRAGTMSITDLSSAAGQRWEFKPEGDDWKAIQVPAGGWRTQGYTCDAGTYRTTLTLPAYDAGNRVRLAFDAINFGAKIYAGKDKAGLQLIAEHIDGWVPVKADLTPFAASGEKLLVQVEVAGRKKLMANGKFIVPEGASWYPGLEEGILRGVHLEIVPAVRVEDVFVQTSVGPDVLKAQVTLANDSDGPATVSLAPTVESANGANFNYPKMVDLTCNLPAKTTRTVDLGDVPWTAGAGSYWWPNVPYRSGYRAQLHRLVLAVKIDGHEVQRYGQPFGFRQFRAVGNHYELNGIHCNLRGDNQQEANFGTDAYGTKKGFGPPTADNPGWPQAVDNLLRLNFNVMRIHQIPATPYMLDVCDEAGLMLVDETPLRGSEGREDFEAGKTNMLNMVRELALRDRNHPAVVIWSAANEWKDPVREASAAIRTVDPTRVIIADGVGDMGPDVINMQHYVTGMPGLPTKGGSFRKDRPYGETEDIWPADNTWQGFAWMGTGVLLRRLEGNADLRNYVLNNAWPNYVPGESPETEVLEVKVKNWGTGPKEIHASLADPWNHPLIRLMQRCYHPLLACDVEYERLNAISNKAGGWPIARPEAEMGTRVVRELAVFNDEFAGEDVTLVWKALSGDQSGPVLAQGELPLHIPLGEFAKPEIAFDDPGRPGEVTLVLSVRKNGQERFADDHTRIQFVTPRPATSR
jgi:hypothetical protein